MTHPRCGAPLLFAALLLSSPHPVVAQIRLPELDGYALNAALWADRNPFTPGGLADFQRLRLMTTPRLGPLALEVAYEHLLSYRQRPGFGAVATLLPGVAPSAGEWIDLSWSIHDDSHLTWSHRFDRLNVTGDLGQRLQIVLGRQAISWATTLLLTPADPFAPFDPSDPFREYRAGVDAARARYFTGPFSELEFVVRPSDTPAGTTVTALGRARGLVGSWDVSGWAGALHDRAALGLGLTGALGGTAVRGEGSLRNEGGDVIPRAALGVDRRVSVLDRDLYLVLEYQHDKFGATGANDLVPVLASRPFARGELQVLGRDELAAQASYQIHPLWTGELLTLWNLRDGSAFVAPAASYSVSDEISARAGLFLGLGSGARRAPAGFAAPGSEYGSTPAIVYASVTAFF